MSDALPSLIGQQSVIAALARYAGSDVAFGHAYIISGADTVAVAGVAQWFTQFVACSAPQHTQPCGECPGCVSHRHADGVWTLSLELQPGETAHSVERIRSLRQFVGMKPVARGRRVVSIERADTLRGAAANALLKSIEEPVSDVVYVCTAHQRSAVLPTIRSRAMSVFLQPVAQQDITHALKQEGYAEKDIAFVSSLYPGQASRIRHELENEQRLQTLRETEHALATWQTLPITDRLHMVTRMLESCADTDAQRHQVYDALHVASRQRTATAQTLRALLNACVALRTNAQPKFIFDAFALQTL